MEDSLNHSNATSDFTKPVTNVTSESSTTPLKYSVIVPVYNEEGAVTALHSEIVKVMRGLNQSFEIIFIDDGSSDQTFERLNSLSPIKIVRFRKNFGQTAALDAGFKYAQGEIFITLDGDGQNDPNDFPKLLKKLDEGYDLVSGWRKNRRDDFSKRLISKGASILRRFFVADNVKDSGCTLKVYRRECFADFDLFGEIHRFIPAVLAWHGFNIGELEVNHRPRISGQTKYNWKRVLKGLIDMISVWFWRKYATRPLHLFGGLGIVLGGCGVIMGLTLFILRAFRIISLVNSVWPLVSFFLILAGIQLFISGLLGDIAIKTYFRDKKMFYSIKNTIENNK
ncbi:MAG: glycosyltransferase family 2 protein [Patescibacteria group bacterium]|jgi:glycosyltransferase involved in cell wall biosynthesis